MNGLSMAFLAETTLILYALKIGVPDYIVAVMASFAFLGTFFVIAGRVFVKTLGTTRTASISWYMRNTFGVFTALAPIIMVYYSPFLGAVVILIGSFGFYSSRGIGLAALLPIIGEITDEEEKGKFNSKTAFSYNIGYFIAMTLLVFLFGISDEISTFQLIIVGGFLIGCYSGYRVSKIPESGIAKESAAYAFRDSLKFCFSTDNIRTLMIVQAICYCSIALVVPYSVLALKEIYEVRDYSALLFIIVQGGGAIVMSVFISKFSKRDSFKKLLFFSYGLLTLVTLIWTAMPFDFKWYYVFIIFLLAGVGQAGIFISLSHYFLNVTPQERLVGSNMAISVFSSVTAGIVGALAGAVVLKSLEFLQLSEISLYKLFFIIIFIFLLSGVFLIMRFEKLTVLNLIKLYKNNLPAHLKE